MSVNQPIIKTTITTSPVKSRNTVLFESSNDANDAKIIELLAKSNLERKTEKKAYEEIIAGLEADNERLNNEYQILKNNYDLLLKRIDDLEAELSRLKNQNAQLLKENTILKRDNQILDENLQAEKERSATAERENSRLQKELSLAEQTKRELNRQLEEERNNVISLKDKLTKAQAEFDRKIAALTKLNDDLKRLLEAKEKEIMNRDATIARIQGDLAESQRALARAQDEADQLTVSLRSAQNDLAREKKAHAATAKERDDLRDQLLELQQRLEAEKAARADIERKLQKALADLQEALGRLAQRDREIEELKAQLASLQAELARQQKTYEDRLRALQADLDAALADKKAMEDQLRAEINALKDKLAALQAEFEKERRRNAAAEAALTAERDNALRKAANAADLQRQLNDALAEIARLRELTDSQTMQLSQSTSSKTFLQNRIDALTKELDDLRAGHSEALQRLDAQFRSMRTNADRQNKATLDSLSSVTIERDSVKRTMTERDREFNTLQNENTGLLGDNKKEKDARERAEKRARDAERERDQLTSRLTTVEKEMQRTIDEHSRALQDKEKQLGEKERAFNAKLKDATTNVTSRDADALLKAQAELEALRAENAKLQAEIERLLAELDALRKEFEALKKEREARPKVINVTTQINLEPEDEEGNAALSSVTDVSAMQTSNTRLRTPDNRITIDSSPGRAASPISPRVYVSSSPEDSGYVVNTVVQLPEQQQSGLLRSVQKTGSPYSSPPSSSEGSRPVPRTIQTTTVPPSPSYPNPLYSPTDKRRQATPPPSSPGSISSTGSRKLKKEKKKH